MPSWDESSSSTNDVLADITPLDLSPDTVDDPTFFGIATDCSEVCRVHKLKPRRCVAFQGSNTGRRFYLCSVLNQVENCGFVSWVDGEWPETAQHALGRLWSMLYDSKSERVVEKCDHVQLIHDVALEKHKLEKKYSSLVEDVNKYCSDTHRQVMQENYAKIMKEGSKAEVEVGQEKEMDLLKKKIEAQEKEIGELKKVIEAQEKEIGELKQVQRSQADVMKVKQENYVAEKMALKEEKKKLEYMIFEMVNASQALKDKLKKIREICDV
ncbi:unnamed protein product [Alopecurus aequalis]